MVRVETVAHEALTLGQRQEIVDLCTRAYEEPFDAFFDGLPGATHLLLYEGNRLASHVAWVERWLQQDGHEPLRTAYIEAVATEPEMQGKGYATRLMEIVHARVQAYPLAALSLPKRHCIRLGWLPWAGPLSLRAPEGIVATPDEEILYLPTAAMPRG